MWLWSTHHGVAIYSLAQVVVVCDVAVNPAVHPRTEALIETLIEVQALIQIL
jgi:hypothetical protein